MKTRKFNLLLLISIFVLSFPLTACSKTRIFGTLPTGESIQKVYLTKSMISMIKSFAGSSIGNDLKKYNLNDILDDISSIEVYTCSNGSYKDEVVKGFDKIIEDHNGEILLESEENGQTSRIYLIFPEKNNDKPDGLLIWTNSGPDISLVAINGDISMDKLAKYLEP